MVATKINVAANINDVRDIKLRSRHIFHQREEQSGRDQKYEIEWKLLRPRNEVATGQEEKKGRDILLRSRQELQ